MTAWSQNVQLEVFSLSAKFTVNKPEIIIKSQSYLTSEGKYANSTVEYYHTSNFQHRLKYQLDTITG